MRAVTRRRILAERARRASARGAVAPRLALPALLLGGALIAAPAPADEAPPTPIVLQVLDTSRLPDSGNWVVVAAAEDAAWRARGGGRWLSFQQGQVVMPGSEIETGPGGDVILVVGGDQVRIAPGTRLLLPAAAEHGRSLHQERGRLRVDVEHRPGRAFSVTMPLLSLGIKGTSFETAVDRNQDAVVVLDGEVEVRPVGRDEPFRLREGQGLRQPAEPGAEPQRFDLPALAVGQGQGGAVPWQLEGTSRTHAQDGSSSQAGDDATAARAARAKAGDRPSVRDSSPTWSEDGISVLILATLATAVLLLLAGPLIDLCRTVFDLDRPVGGQRRRDLTRG